MKCKPLCFDYHSEATYLLRERRKQSSSRIRISTRCIDDDEEEPPSPRIEETTTSAAVTRKQRFKSSIIMSSTVDVEKRQEFHAEQDFETSQDTKLEWLSSCLLKSNCNDMQQDDTHTTSLVPVSNSMEVEPSYLDTNVVRLSRKSDASSRKQVLFEPNKKRRRLESSSSRVVVLPPRPVSIYDFPFLVQLLSSIRRQANCKRVANYAFVDPYCILVNRSFRPWNSTAWMKMVQSVIFYQCCMVSAMAAIVALDRIAQIPKRPLLLPSVHKEETNQASAAMYRYCLLDLLQNKAGTFVRCSWGSRDTRNQTRKRELKAIIPYCPRQPNVVNEMQNACQFALLVAMRLLQQQRNSNRDSNREKEEIDSIVLPEKRKSSNVDEQSPSELKHTELQKGSKSVDARCSNAVPIASSPSKRHAASHISLPTSAAKRPRTSPPFPTTNDITANQNEESKAKAKEFSLLERFGLAPKTDQDRTCNTIPSSKPRSIRLVTSHSNKHVARSRTDIVAPPLRCDSPSSLDFRLKTRSRNLAIERERQQRKRSLTRSTSNHKQKMTPSVPSSQEKSLQLGMDPSQIQNSWSTRDDDGTQHHGSSQVKNGAQSPVQSLRSKERQFFSVTSISQSPKLSQGKDVDHRRVFESVASSPKVDKTKKERKHARKLAKKLKKGKKKRKKEAKKRHEHQTIREESGINVDARNRTVVDESVRKNIEKTNCPSPFPPINSNSNEHEPLNVLMPLNDKENTRSATHMKSYSTAANDQSHSGNPDSLILLCSESFLETWGEVAGKLTSGDWKPSRHSEDVSLVKSAKPGSLKICLFDTSLVDKCGVDIETPDRGGIIVSSLSSWQNAGFQSLIKRVVDLISTSKYRYLDVFVCADIDQDDVATNNIVTLQNAALHQSTNLATSVSISIVSPRSLATSIGYSVYMLRSSLNLEEIEAWVSDERTYERIHFLLSLIPTLTTTTVVHCLLSSPLTKDSQKDRSRLWFQNLFSENDCERQRLQAMDYRSLHPAAMTQLSFALRVNIGPNSTFQHD